MTDRRDPLQGFSTPTKSWFTSRFPAPTPAQCGAWQAIAGGDDVLVISPTGSGKTLAAFLTAIDRITGTWDNPTTSVVYISPLKALAADVEKNLAIPLRGIEEASRQLGAPRPPVRVGMRTGDTDAAQRRRLVTHPPDILVTTPESLFLMLSSAARRTLGSVSTVIVDEVHTLAGTKRGAHLALSLERLAEMHPHQRIGLSATVSPPQAAARFLSGERLCTVVSPPIRHDWDVQIRSAVPDMTDLGVDLTTRRSNSIHPLIAEQILDLCETHTSTLCFVNSRRHAERLTAKINELHLERQGQRLPDELPSSFVGVDATCRGGDIEVMAMAHHGSVSKEHRAWIENQLKQGQLKCVVATSSLELGIDMGTIDLVIQVGAPISVSSALQRVGRAGHQVGATSRCVWFPITRDDLLTSTAVLQLMTVNAVEPMHELSNPLDVLTQQLVSMCLDRSWDPGELYVLVKRAHPFSTLPRSLFDAVVDMLCGAYPSEEFSALRARLVRDPSGRLRARTGMRSVVTRNAGTIPDRGLYPVLLSGDGTDLRHPTQLIGELDEEMVHESRVGDLITLGTCRWLGDAITANHVVVSPASGRVGRLPFWRSDAHSRPLAIGGTRTQIADQLLTDPKSTRSRLAKLGLDEWAINNLTAHVSQQVEVTGVLPGENLILIERFRDELGDWQVCIHCALGTAITTGLGMVMESVLGNRAGPPVQVTAIDDGLVLRIPDSDSVAPGTELLMDLPTEIETVLTSRVACSALFAGRFRECAARALMIPRSFKGGRSPLWQQRLRASQLLDVARHHPDFPITLETMRECLEDVLDLDALRDLLIGIREGTVRVVDVYTETASPMARGMMFNLLAGLGAIYDTDQQLTPEGGAVLDLSPQALDDLLGRPATTDLLDPEVADELTAQMQNLAPGWICDDVEAVWDMLARIGPLTPDEVEHRCDPPQRQSAGGWLTELRNDARVMVWGRWLMTTQDFSWLPNALDGDRKGLERLIARWARNHIMIRATDIAERFELPMDLVAEAVATVAAEQSWNVIGNAHITSANLAKVRSRTVARRRATVRPVTADDVGRFLTRWHGLDEPSSGAAALSEVVSQLSGVRLPLSQLDLVLSGRIADHDPAALDALLSSGMLRWRGAGAIGATDGWIELWAVGIPAHECCSELSPEATTILERLQGGGSWTIAELFADARDHISTRTVVQELVWSGSITSASLSTLRQLCGTSAAQVRVRDPRPGARRSRRLLRIPPTDPILATTWRAWSDDKSDPATLALRDLDLLIDRQGIICRPGFETHHLPTTFSDVRRLATRLEERGELQRGWYCPKLGGVQFTTGQVAAGLRNQDPTGMVVLAASDPANPYGSVLAWPTDPDCHPTRSAGSVVVINDGHLVAHLERGHKTMLVLTDDEEGASALRRLCAELGDLTITKVNGTPALSTRRGLFEAAGAVMVPQGWRLRRGSLSD